MAVRAWLNAGSYVMDTTIIAAVITIVCGLIFGIVAYLLMQRDNQRQEDITKLELLIKETAENVLNEKDKTASLVLSESRATAALVLSENKATAALVLAEKDKLAITVKAEHNHLEEKFNNFRINVAENYTTTNLLKEITKPLLDKLDEIERLLHTKIGRAHV